MSSSSLYVISPEEAARLRMEAAVRAKEKNSLRAFAITEQLRNYSSDEPCHRIISDIMEVCSSVHTSSAGLEVDELERQNAENTSKLSMVYDYLSNPNIQRLLDISHGVHNASEKVAVLCKISQDDNSLMHEVDKLGNDCSQTLLDLSQIMSANILVLSETELQTISDKAQVLYDRFIASAKAVTKLSEWRVERKAELTENADLMDFEKKEIMSFQELVQTYSIIESTNPKRSVIKELLSETEKYLVFEEDKDKLHVLSRQYELGIDNSLMLIKIFLHSLIINPPSVMYNTYTMLAKELGVEPVSLDSFSSTTDLKLSLDDLNALYFERVKGQFIKSRINEAMKELGFEQLTITLEDREGQLNLITGPDNEHSFIYTENEEQDFLYLESVMIKDSNRTVTDTEILDYRQDCCEVMDKIISVLSEKGVDVQVRKNVEPRADNCTFIDKSSLNTDEMGTISSKGATKKVFADSFDGE